MKWDKDLIHKNIHTFLLIAACILFYLVLMNLQRIGGLLGGAINILSPFLIGFVIAYLLNAPLNFFEKTIFPFVGRKKSGRKARRALALVATFLAALIVLVTLVSIIIPQVTQSVSMLINNTGMYISRLQSFLYEIAEHLGVDRAVFEEMFAKWENLTTDLVGLTKELLPKIKEYIPDVFNFSKQVTTGISHAFVGIAVSVYVLADKEKFGLQVRRVMSALLKKSTADRIFEIVRFSHSTFFDFITGKLVDSLIVGVICFVAMNVLNLPFALLISVIVGVTNIIPIFGAILGGVIGAFIVLMVDPVKMIWFVILIVVLQQLDGNVIGPKILGESTGLSSFWVMFAIVVGGGMFGFVGMFVGVPVFSVIYSLLRTWLEKRMEKKAQLQGE